LAAENAFLDYQGELEREVRLKRKRIIQISGTFREVMLANAVDAGNYKFKTLSLDGSELTFVIMVETQALLTIDMARLKRIEATTLKVARLRGELALKGIFWRMAEHRLPLGSRFTERSHDYAET
jgi:hypothetical protein